VRPVTNTILIVDDNEDDVFAIRRALRKAEVSNPQQIVSNGQLAMDYLAGIGPYSDRTKFPLPFIVFLDLKMPFRDGFDVLTWMRDQPALSDIVVVVLTGSDEVRDHQRAYSLGARSYLVKPASAADVQQLFLSLESRWMRASSKSPVESTAGK
jgi:CheY-like chemotaxis protein